MTSLPTSRRNTFGVVALFLIAAVAAAVWTWRTRRPAITTALPPQRASIERETLGRVGLSEPAQLLRNYQGRVERADGKKLWLYLEIHSIEQRGDRVAFTYFMSSPTETTTGDGEVAADGTIRFDGFRGRVVTRNEAIVLHSIGIDGPPYWRLVGRRDTTR